MKIFLPPYLMHLIETYKNLRDEHNKIIKFDSLPFYSEEDEIRYIIHYSLIQSNYQLTKTIEEEKRFKNELEGIKNESGHI